MITFKNKQKRQRTTNLAMLIEHGIIRRTELTLSHILVKGVGLTGYQKLSEHKRNRESRRLMSASSGQRQKEQSLEQAPGLFKNSAIRTRLKSLQIQICITPCPSQIKKVQRKHSFQKEPLSSHQQLSIGTHPVMNHKPKSERQIIPQTDTDWTNRKCRVKQQQGKPTKCHITRINTLKQSIKKGFMLNSGKATHLQTFNDSLLVQREEYLSLRKLEGSNQAQLRLTSQQSNRQNSSMLSQPSQPASVSVSKGKVRYFIRLGKQQKAAGPSQLQSARLLPKCAKQQISTGFY